MTKLVLFESVVDVRTELNLLSQGVRQHFASEELKYVKDLQAFLLKKEEGWVLDKNLHALVSRILTDTRPELVGMKVSLLRLFSVCALRENFIHYLNLDRQDRVLMNFAAADFNVRSLNEQKGLSLLFCNMFATPSRRWLMYFSEWTTHDGELTSNAEIQLYASGLVFNMSATDFGFTQSLDVIMQPLCPEEQPIGSVNLGNDDGICHLKAHNKVLLEISTSTFDVVKRKAKTLPEDVLWNYLQTLERVLPNIRADFLTLHPEMGSDLELVGQLKTMTQRNKDSITRIIELN